MAELTAADRLFLEDTLRRQTGQALEAFLEECPSPLAPDGKPMMWMDGRPVAETIGTALVLLRELRKQ